MEPHFIKDGVGCDAFCHTRDKVIVLDVTRYRTSRFLRGVLLHEMCHAAAGPQSRGHDRLFFEEVERLFAMGVPVSVNLWRYDDEPAIRTLPHCAARLARMEQRAAVDEGNRPKSGVLS